MTLRPTSRSERRNGLVPVLGVFLAFLPAVPAAELVVDQKNAVAADTNPGTAAKPFRTISAAAAKAAPGDHVLIHGGEYRETVIINTSGSDKVPIIFEAVPGETPIIKGSDRLTDWTSDGGAVWKTKLPAPAPRPKAGDTAAYWQTNDVRQVFARDGVGLEAQRLERVKDRSAMMEGSFYGNPAESLLYVWLPNSVSPIEHPPEASVRAAWINVYASHVIIRGLQMRHASTTAIANWPACNLKGDDIMLENCTISWGDFVGVSMSGTGNSLRNCLIACNGDSGIGGTGTKHLIEGCRVVFNNTDRYDSQWHAGGAKLIPNFRQGTIRHNEFAHNLGPGLWLDEACNDNVIDGNISHDNEGPGIMVEISRDNLVMNNICHANRNSLSGPYRDSKGALAEKEISKNRIGPSRLFKLYHAGDGRGINVSSAPATKVLFNTCYLNEAEGICVEGPPRRSGPETMTTTEETVANNISVFNKGSQLTLHHPAPGETPTASDHNILFAVGAVFAKYGWEGPVAMSMPEWQKVSGQDAHSLDSDPRFAMAAMEDFRVFPNSPAVGAGRPFPEADHDFFGRPRGKAKTTIGACEQPAKNYPEPLWQSLSQEIRSAH